jgi:hypothetical protein
MFSVRGLSEDSDPCRRSNAADDHANSKDARSDRPGTSVAALMTMVESGLPPDPIIEGNSAMTPYEMEQQLTNLDLHTKAIEQMLPTLATKQDLRDEAAKLATKDDLRLTTDALQHEMAKLATRDELNVGLEDAKRYTLLLIQATRGEIRQIREEMATKGDLQRLEMATKGDFQRLEMATKRDFQRLEMATKGELQRLEKATKRDLQQLQRTLSKQIATLRAPGRKKL